MPWQITDVSESVVYLLDVVGCVLHARWILCDATNSSCTGHSTSSGFIDAALWLEQCEGLFTSPTRATAASRWPRGRFALWHGENIDLDIAVQQLSFTAVEDMGASHDSKDITAHRCLKCF
jgi:hypothetical protein